jgi:WXG100 family type VII secretion target
MSAPIVRCEHDKLKNVASIFDDEAQKLSNAFSKVTEAFEKLHGGDWIGKGEKVFAGEMNGSVLPACKRLVNALMMAGTKTEYISREMKRAEGEARAALQEKRWSIDDTN